MAADEDLVMGNEAAAILGVTRQHLTMLARQGVIGRQELGRYWVFTRAELEAYKGAPKNKGGRPKSFVRAPSPVALAT